MMPCGCPEGICYHPDAQNCERHIPIMIGVDLGVPEGDRTVMSDYVPPSYPLAPDNSARHDAKGSKRWPLQPGVRGSAGFMGSNECYRIWLRRDWGAPGVNAPYALFIGMNPSTAEAEIDDPTIRAELDFTRALGLDSYIKCNVGAYRATFPKDLKFAGVELCPDANISTIIAFATHAAHVIAAWGRLPEVLKRDGETILFRLRSAAIPVWCLGTNSNGSPKHPLYVTRTTPLERFR